jgi:AcrR family transcriptional regulator
MSALDYGTRQELGAKGSNARERLLAAAYELFSSQGVQAVGVEAIIERSGVARQTMYRHFGSKQELVLAFLGRREQVWTRDWLQAEAGRRAEDPGDRLLAIFDVFDEWFHRPDFEGCSFINVLLEYPDAEHPLHKASTAYLAGIRRFLQGLAQQAGAGSRLLRAPMAHPHEGLDRGRRRGRPRSGTTRAEHRPARARAGYSSCVMNSAIRDESRASLRVSPLGANPIPA